MTAQNDDIKTEVAPISPSDESNVVIVVPGTATSDKEFKTLEQYMTAKHPNEWRQDNLTNEVVKTYISAISAAQEAVEISEKQHAPTISEHILLVGPTIEKVAQDAQSKPGGWKAFVKANKPFGGASQKKIDLYRSIWRRFQEAMDIAPNALGADILETPLRRLSAKLNEATGRKPTRSGRQVDQAKTEISVTDGVKKLGTTAGAQATQCFLIEQMIRLLPGGPDKTTVLEAIDLLEEQIGDAIRRKKSEVEAGPLPEDRKSELAQRIEKYNGAATVSLVEAVVNGEVDDPEIVDRVRHAGDEVDPCPEPKDVPSVDGSASSDRDMIAAARKMLVGDLRAEAAKVGVEVGDLLPPGKNPSVIQREKAMGRILAARSSGVQI